MKVKKFIVLYHAPVDAMTQMASTTPEQMEKGMGLWKTWAAGCGDKLSDLGAPLVNGQTLFPDGTVKSSSKHVTGYSILMAENMEEAAALFKDHPHNGGYNAESTIDIHEIMLIPGM